ncbi:unnamed protein product [Diplocarpon coronariae]
MVGIEFTDDQSFSIRSTTNQTDATSGVDGVQEARHGWHGCIESINRCQMLSVTRGRTCNHRLKAASKVQAGLIPLMPGKQSAAVTGIRRGARGSWRQGPTQSSTSLPLGGDPSCGIEGSRAQSRGRRGVIEEGQRLETLTQVMQ